MSFEAVDAPSLVRALGVPVAGLVCDSRRARDGVAFAAFPGEAADGRRFIGSAVAAGAVGVFWEREGFVWRESWGVPNVAVDGLRARCGEIADAVFEAPSRALEVAAVTGTNGKTTVTAFVAQLLRFAGRRCGVVGTLGAGEWEGGEWRRLGNTTPDAALLQECLRGFADAGVEACAVEASSHGICQGRLRGTRLAVAAVTNVAVDHLDYHGDWDGYCAAKAALFDAPFAGVAVRNADDYGCEVLARRVARVARREWWTYGRDGTALRLRDAVWEEGGWRLEVAEGGGLGRCTLRLPVPGAHNVGNFLAAALVALALGVDAAAVREGGRTLRLPAGRMQRVEGGGGAAGPAVFVDYAHAPDAVAVAVAAGRAFLRARRGRLWVVFGAGGGRDAQKRAAMARAAGGADEVVVTDDNPRFEEAAAIRAELCRALPRARNVGGRDEAIAAAVGEAAVGDVVLVLGKGHETVQEVGGEAVPFSDVEVVRECLRRGRKGEL